jgi:diadenosine tetraphosphate (Ap4A) HIT family hydrolase
MCPFCSPDASRVVATAPLAFARRDAYPVSPGHTLIVPRRHVGSFFDASDDERTALLDLLARTKAILDQEHSPAGYNIGINDGAAAGQTIAHLHIHLIPRYVGDQPDPRGGVRWIFPERANYWDGGR